MSLSFTYLGPEASGSKAASVGSEVNIAITGPKTGLPDEIINLFEVVLYAATESWDAFVASVDPDNATAVDH